MKPSLRARLTASLAVGALVGTITLVAAQSGSAAAPAPVTTQADLARLTLASCQLAAANSTGTEHTRWTNCVHDQTHLLALLAASSTPPATTTAPPSSTAPATTTTAPTTLPPTTTPVPTTTAPSPTATPTPTPTATPPAAAYPTVSNRGLPPGVTTSPNGTCTLSTDNAVYDAQHWTCRVQVAARGVVIKRSQLDGGIDDWANYSHGATTFAGGSFTLTDSNVGVLGGSCNGNFGVGASAFTASRNRIVSFGDGFRTSGRDATPISIADNFVSTCYVSGGHADGLQDLDNVAPVTVSHNTLDISQSATVPSNPTGGGPWTAAFNETGGGSLTLLDNVLRGGGWVIDIWPGSGDIIKVTSNKVVDHSWEYVPVHSDCANIGTWSANTLVTLDGAGQPAPGVALACG